MTTDMAKDAAINYMLGYLAGLTNDVLQREGANRAVDTVNGILMAAHANEPANKTPARERDEPMSVMDALERIVEAYPSARQAVDALDPEAREKFFGAFWIEARGAADVALRDISA